ncbi:hypothetical protein FRB99_003107 [Tulasnella sp. 403]|nr:hypothetical protein FRB99_003107 [Tulasnella sp. 403]
MLFVYLASDYGKRLQIETIDLNSCQIGNMGLEAITNFLHGNTTLEQLNLQNNLVNPSLVLTCRFTAAVNNSRLRRLSLDSNKRLSDTFLFRFLPNLTTTHLHDLSLNDIGLTSFSTAHIVNFLSTDGPASSKARKLFAGQPSNGPSVTRLRVLHLAGNALTQSCLIKIVDTLQTSNFSIRNLDVTSTHTNDLNRKIAGIRSRNVRLELVTKLQARRLLIPSRVLLREPRGHGGSALPSPWYHLPTELRLYILSLVSPRLSTRQQFQIWRYATDGDSHIDGPHRLCVTKPDSAIRWLEAVGCDHFEPYDGWEQVLERL